MFTPLILLSSFKTIMQDQNSPMHDDLIHDFNPLMYLESQHIMFNIKTICATKTSPTTPKIHTHYNDLQHEDHSFPSIVTLKDYQ